MHYLTQDILDYIRKDNLNEFLISGRTAIYTYYPCIAYQDYKLAIKYKSSKIKKFLNVYLSVYKKEFFKKKVRFDDRVEYIP